MTFFSNNTLSLEQTITINYVSAHCMCHKRPLKWYEEQLALKGHIGLSDYLRSELPADEKVRLKHNDIGTLANDLISYVGRCGAQGKPFRVLTYHDVIEPDHTNELSYFIWAKDLGLDIDTESWSPHKAWKLAPVQLGYLAAQTCTMISRSNTPWTTWLAQLVTDLNKSLHNPGAPTSPPRTCLPLQTSLSLDTAVDPERGPVPFRSGGETDDDVSSDKIQHPSPEPQKRDCVKLRVKRKFDMVRMGVMDDGGHGGKLAFLVCLYKRLHTEVKLPVLIDLSEMQSLLELLLFLCQAIFEKLGQAKILPNDPIILNVYITEMIELYNNAHEPLKTVDHVPESPKEPREVLACLHHLFPGDLDCINLQSITYKQFAIVVGFYLGQTDRIPRHKAGLWYLTGIATDIANAVYPRRVSVLLDESHLCPTGTFYHSDSGDSETEEEGEGMRQLEGEITNLDLSSKDASNRPSKDYYTSSQPDTPFASVDTLQYIAGHPQIYHKILILYVALHGGSSQAPYDFTALYEAFMQNGLFNFLKLLRRRLAGTFRPYRACRHDLLADFEDLRLRVKTRNGHNFTRLHISHQLERGLDDKTVLLLLGQAARIPVPECSRDTLAKIALLTGMLLAESGRYILDDSSVTSTGYKVALYYLLFQECPHATSLQSSGSRSPSATATTSAMPDETLIGSTDDQSSRGDRSEFDFVDADEGYEAELVF
ncbi:uncharacterized protein FMAN_07317 [Fusarium mangiferae]|uniref:Uncharacterized protein n=1 Tax=Fusarium mangiferae TaxID=192010 RepID=A0A1L7TAU1_FUSMA|nr:uncharacterized protein FMAN_07317 [Fusarium mangiferae]CVK92421.1 uncharacterized protein FMAN_07317 [Fusarium mangiferae]